MANWLNAEIGWKYYWKGENVKLIYVDLLCMIPYHTTLFYFDNSQLVVLHQLSMIPTGSPTNSRCFYPLDSRLDSDS